MLVNAIFFKCPWKYPFEVQNTKLAQFYGDNSRILRVPFMTSEDEFPYGDLPDLKAKIVSIPYKVAELCYTISTCNSDHDFTHRATGSACRLSCRPDPRQSRN